MLELLQPIAPYAPAIMTIGFIIGAISLPILAFSTNDRVHQIAKISFFSFFPVFFIGMGALIAQEGNVLDELKALIEIAKQNNQPITVCGEIIDDPTNLYKELSYLKYNSGPVHTGKHVIELEIACDPEPIKLNLKRSELKNNHFFVYYLNEDPSPLSETGHLYIDLPDVLELFGACESVRD